MKKVLYSIATILVLFTFVKLSIKNQAIDDHVPTFSLSSTHKEDLYFHIYNLTDFPTGTIITISNINFYVQHTKITCGNCTNEFDIHHLNVQVI